LRLSFELRGYDAAVIPADADLHALSNHYSDAMHEMWHTDEAGPDRAASAEFGFADLPVRPMRLRRELFEADVDRRKPDPADQHPSPEG
jgi:elongation factor P hydroxylase